MSGEILVNVHDLLAIRDALIADDKFEAYHRLRLVADPDCSNAVKYGDHWHPWQEIAKAVPQTARK